MITKIIRPGVAGVIFVVLLFVTWVRGAADDSPWEYEEKFLIATGQSAPVADPGCIIVVAEVDVRIEEDASKREELPEDAIGCWKLSGDNCECLYDVANILCRTFQVIWETLVKEYCFDKVGNITPKAFVIVTTLVSREICRPLSEARLEIVFTPVRVDKDCYAACTRTIEGSLPSTEESRGVDWCVAAPSDSTCGCLHRSPPSEPGSEATPKTIAAMPTPALPDRLERQGKGPMPIATPRDVTYKDSAGDGTGTLHHPGDSAALIQRRVAAPTMLPLGMVILTIALLAIGILVSSRASRR